MAKVTAACWAAAGAPDAWTMMTADPNKCTKRVVNIGRTSGGFYSDEAWDDTRNLPSAAPGRRRVRFGEIRCLFACPLRGADERSLEHSRLEVGF